MFEIQLPWWELVARGAVVYVALLVMVRVSGKRTIGRFTPFELLVVMLLSEAVSNSLTGSDDSQAGGLLVAATLMTINVLIAVATSRNRRMEQMMDGTPVLLGHDGKIFLPARKKARVSEKDIAQALREADCTLEKTQCIILDAEGNISVIKKPKFAQAENGGVTA